MASRSDSSSFAVTAAVLALIAVLGAGFLVSRLTAPEAELEEQRAAAARATPARQAQPDGEGRRERAAQRRRRAAPAPAEVAPEGRAARRAEQGQPNRAADNGTVQKRQNRRAANDGAARGRHNRAADDGAAQTNVAGAPPRSQGGAPAPPRPGEDGNSITADHSMEAVDQALTMAGVAPAVMADLELRYEELAAAEKELRGTATEEGWLHSPRFAEEMDAIEADRLAIRDEVGDEAYDLVLFSTGQTNRVLVNSIDPTSPAGAAGLQASDLIVSYDGVRIFSPAGLLAEMAAGTGGREVAIEVLRQGKRVKLEIPDGLLAIDIGPAQDPPEPLR